MNKTHNLSDLKIGQKAKVTSVNINGNMRRRLLDIGITVGTETECVFKSPFGEPTAFLVRGAIIALRKEECENIIITLMNERMS